MADSTVASSPLFFPLFVVRRKRKSTAERRHTTEVRVQLYERSQGLCELRSSPKCLRRCQFLGKVCTLATSFTAAAAERGIWIT